MRREIAALAVACWLGSASGAAHADENLFGYVRGAETLPKGAWEFYQWTTARFDKGIGHYQAFDTNTELEYGVSDSFNLSGGIKTLSIDTEDIFIDGYLPGPKHYVLNPSGLEFAGKYNFLKPALGPIGLSGRFGIEYDWKDPHSGQKKDTVSAETSFILQRYFLEGQMVWVGTAAIEATYADRHAIDDLPPGFDWPTDPEMEIEFKFGTGLSYRFVESWFLGLETMYETEYETEIGQERWTLFLGPSLHYGGVRFWGTFTWFPQIAGGGEEYPGQTSDHHLVEKTKHEIRLKLGINF
jgi:hypothetical protein